MASAAAARLLQVVIEVHFNLQLLGLNSDVIRRLVLANWTILFVLARLFSITNFDTAMSLYEMTPNHSASLQLLLHWHCGLWPDALRNAC